MISFNTLLNFSYQQALKSPYKQRMSAVIFNKNRVISLGYNKPKSHKRKLHPKFKKWPNSIHAEAAAILNAKTSLKGANILVVRLDANDNFTLAKPCAYCKKYINYVGIKSIYYTISENAFVACSLGVITKNKPDYFIDLTY